MNSPKQYFLVNDEGEVLKTVENPETSLVILNKGDRVIRKKSIDYLANTEKIKYPFIKVNYEQFGDICREVPLVGCLLPFIIYSNCMLVYENNVFVTPRNFAMRLGISYSTSRRVFRTLEKMGVIKKQLSSPNKYIYYFNPYIACRGTRIEVETLNMFCKSIGSDNYGKI